MEKQTDKRRKAPISYRLPKGKEDEFAVRVERSGLSQNGYISRCIFGSADARASRRPKIEQQLIAQLLSQAARLHDDLSQISHLAGENPSIAGRLDQANSELAAIRAACFKAFGKKP